MSELSIIHTGDFHNRLGSAAECVLTKERAVSQNTLLLDAGDAIRSGNIGFDIRGERILRRMTSIGYDAMSMGNREFHFKEFGLRQKLKCAGFPVLCANLRSDIIDIRKYVDPYIIKIVGEISVGIFGLTAPMITGEMFVSRFSPFRFDDPLDVSADIIAEIRPQCDLLVALTHIGLDKDIRLAERTTGIDLIIGGHSHTFQDKLQRVNGAYISHTGYWGQNAARIDINIMNGCIESIDKRHIDLKAR